MAIRFDEGSTAYDLLRVLMHVAEYPYKSLDLIGNERWVKRVYRQMLKEGYISSVGKVEMQSIRLKKKGLELGRELFGEEIYEYYMRVSENRKFRGDETRIWRNHRDAEVATYMLFQKAKMLPSEKPRLTIDGSKNVPLPTNDIWYYTNKEIKQVDRDGLLEVAFTRIKGLMVSPGGIYCLYNTNKGSIQWSNAGEAKIKRLLTIIVNSTFEGNSEIEIEDSIVFGQGYETATDIFLRPKRTIKRTEFLSFDKTYDSIYYAPFEDYGKVQLFLLTQKDYENRLINAIFPKELHKGPNINIECHAFDKKEKKYILLFFGGNVRQLLAFNKSAKLFAKEAKFEIVSFPWQSEFLKEVSNDNVTFKTISTKNIMTQFTK